jgi:hypothetical protein
MLLNVRKRNIIFVKMSVSLQMALAAEIRLAERLVLIMIMMMIVMNTIEIRVIITYLIESASRFHFTKVINKTC